MGPGGNFGGNMGGGGGGGGNFGPQGNNANMDPLQAATVVLMGLKNML